MMMSPMQIDETFNTTWQFANWSASDLSRTPSLPLVLGLGPLHDVVKLGRDIFLPCLSLPLLDFDYNNA